MTILELRSKFLSDLALLYPKEEIQSFYNLLIAHKLKLTRTEIALNLRQVLIKTDLEYLLIALSELKNEKPIQYIIGLCEFYGLEFKVNKHVLIPRPETSELINWLLNDTRKKREYSHDSRLKILDIGTGSGCIAITLAKNLSNAIVYAIDISRQALQVAEQNAIINAVDVQFMELDILNTSTIPVTKGIRHSLNSLKFDIIVSNPPYVRQLEKHQIQNNVLEYEPHLALFIKDSDPLLFYEKIADFANENLCKNGQLFFEINQYLSKETVILLKQKGFRNVKMKKDIFGNDRMIRACFNH